MADNVKYNITENYTILRRQRGRKEFLSACFRFVDRRVTTVFAKTEISLNIEHILLPRCMECRRGLAMRKLSVRLFVHLSDCLSVKRVDCDK